MDNEIKHDEINQRFLINHNGRESHLQYQFIVKGTIDLIHTYVPVEFRNRGLASKMAAEALNYARINNLKVIPSCGFVKDFIRRNEEYKDLLL